MSCVLAILPKKRYVTSRAKAIKKLGVKFLQTLVSKHVSRGEGGDSETVFYLFMKLVMTNFQNAESKH